MARTWTVWLRWWVALALLWMLLVSKIDKLDIITAVALATVVATVASAFEKLDLVPFRGNLRWLKHFAALPGQMLRDTGIVFVALARQIAGRGRVEGRIIRIPFEPGVDTDPYSEARRALVVAGVSTPPNTFVAGLDKQRGELVIHQLVPTSEPPGHGDKEWPI